MNSMLVRNIINAISMATEILAVLYLFRRVPRKTESRISWLGYLCFGFLAFFYFSPIRFSETASETTVQNFTEQVLRTIVHFLIIWAVLWFLKETSLSVKAYFAAFYTVLYLAVQNVRILLVLLAMFYRAEWNYQFWFRLAVIPMELLTVLVVHHFVCFEKIRHVGGIRWFTSCMGIFLQLYIKWSLLTMQEVIGETRRWESSAIYSFCAILGIVILLILFEVNSYHRAEASRLEMEKLRTDYENQSARRSMQTNEEIRRLYHDMKNHLTALRGMEESEEAGRYIDTLLEQVQGYETNVHTGSSIVDSVLSEKVLRARREKIDFNICLDLHLLAGIAPMDLVTIFGNAADNAIEASMALPEGMERIIYMKSSAYANYLAVRISNQFSGRREEREGVLPTRKDDASSHGIGLSSIRRSIEKYNGSMQISVDNENHWFRMMILMPVPE